MSATVVCAPPVADVDTDAVLAASERRAECNDFLIEYEAECEDYKIEPISSIVTEVTLARDEGLPVRHLSAIWCDLQDAPRQGDLHAAALGHAQRFLPSLRELHLCGLDSLTHLGMQTLGSAVCALDRLLAIDITDTQMRDAGCAILCRTLSISNSIRSLNLSNNRIGDIGCIALATFLKGNRSLINLKLGLGYNRSVIKDSLWSDTVSNRNHSERLYLDQLAQTISYHRDVRLIQFPKTDALSNRNEITCEGCSALASALKYNKCLAKLDLLGNPVGIKGFIAMFSALERNTNLLELGMSCWWHGVAQLDSEAMITVANCLQVNKSLKLVDFGYMLAFEKGIKAAPTVLSKLSSGGFPLKHDSDFKYFPSPHKLSPMKSVFSTSSDGVHCSSTNTNSSHMKAHSESIQKQVTIQRNILLNNSNNSRPKNKKSYVPSPSREEFTRRIRMELSSMVSSVKNVGCDRRLWSSDLELQRREAEEKKRYVREADLLMQMRVDMVGLHAETRGFRNAIGELEVEELDKAVKHAGKSDLY